MLAGLFLAAGIAFASVTFAGAWTRISEANVINVTGSARRNVRSDLVVWRAGISVDAPSLLEAQGKLQDDFAKVAAWLRQQGLTDFTAAPAQIQELTARRHADDDTVTQVRVGYRLTQAIEIRSPDVERVPALAGGSVKLLQQGVAFVSNDMSFIYTKAGEAKVEMMAEATKDARLRAEQIAVQGGKSLEGLRSARMGVIQINPLHSTATSWEGNNDTATLDKTITATVSATFALR